VSYAHAHLIVRGQVARLRLCYGASGHYFLKILIRATSLSARIDPRRSTAQLTSLTLGLFGRLGHVLGGRELQARHDHRNLRPVSPVLLSVK
jgi:hypothetical protein